MILTNLKITIRKILKEKYFSIINIVGLVFGIAAVLIVYLYISYEKSYDTFNANADNIYRIKNVRYYTSGTDSSAGCPSFLGPALKEDIPEVVSFVRVRKIEALVTVNNKYFSEKKIFWADSSFLTIFSYPLISGKAENALANKNTAVLTISTAEKYFGEENALGKMIQIDRIDFEITGIAKNPPQNSHIKFDILISFNTQYNNSGFCRTCNNNNTYVQLTTRTRKSDVHAKLPLIVSKLHNRQEDGFDRAYFLQPLRDIHLTSALRFEHEENGNAKTIYFLSLIALAIMVMAWINYINISTARSLERAKESGLRKVLGAGSWSLVLQFLFETFIINLIAVSVSLIIVSITFPFWNQLVALPASIWKITDLTRLLLILFIVIPVIAGIYPAFVLSSYSPKSILHGSPKGSAKGILLRKALVVTQFTISIVLIAGIIIFNQQLDFMLNKDLGLNVKKKLVVIAPFKIQSGSDRATSSRTFISELQNQSFIESGTFTSVIPGIENGNVTGGVRQSEQSYGEGKQVYFIYIAQNYLNFFDIDLIKGRNFFENEVKELYADNFNAKGLIINEQALKEFGFSSSEKALGALLYVDKNPIGNVIGVIKDYHQQSLDKEIKPTVFEGVSSGNYFVFDINTEDLPKKIDGIKNKFESIFPGNPFEHYFLDEFFNNQYTANIQTAKTIGLFTILSIIISCLGLIGLSSIMTIQRTKEIGIRKVHGSSSLEILTLVLNGFVKWLLIANLIAFPVAYYFMNNWLNKFAYRIELSLWVLAYAGVLAFGIALLTIGWQSWRAASGNPVEALRYE